MPIDPQHVRIPLKPVTSSSLAALGYDADRQILAVQFRSGGIYHYAGVSPACAAACACAPSLGSYVATQIKGKYPMSRQNDNG